jgi:hypothetical protein
VRPVPGEHAAVHPADGQQVELERGDDAEAAVAAAGGPQQVGVVGVRGSHERAVGRNELHGGDRAALETGVAGIPAQPTAERGADDAHAGAGGVPRREPDGSGPADDVPPSHPCADAGGTAFRIDVQPGHGRGPHQDRVLEAAGQWRRAVSGALGGDPQSQPGSRAYDVRDLGGERRVRHRRRSGIDLQVPRPPDLLVRRVAGEVHSAAAEGAQHTGSRVGHGKGVRSHGDPHVRSPRA